MRKHSKNELIDGYSLHFFCASNWARSWLLKSSSTLSSSQLSSQTLTSSSFSLPSAHSVNKIVKYYEFLKKNENFITNI